MYAPAMGNCQWCVWGPAIQGVCSIFLYLSIITYTDISYGLRHHCFAFSKIRKARFYALHGRESIVAVLHIVVPHIAVPYMAYSWPIWQPYPPICVGSGVAKLSTLYFPVREPAFHTCQGCRDSRLF